MANAPRDKDDRPGLGLDLEIEGLDEEALQRLLEEDPALEAELRAIEEAEAQAQTPPLAQERSPRPAEAPPTPADAVFGDDPSPAETTALAPFPEDGHADFGEHPSEDELPPAHDDLDDYEIDEARTVAAQDHGMPADPFDVDDGVPPLGTGEEAEAASAVEAMAPIPRINIHAFCRSDIATALMQRASVDRRLAKAHVTLHDGDVQRAAEVYADEPSPNLIILEAEKTPQALIRGLEELAQFCDPSTRVIVIGEINDIQLYRALMDRGVSDYIVKPRSPMDVIAAISRLYEDPLAPAVGKSFAFIGARGGVGSSAISHNVAWLMGEVHRSDTIILDFDLAFGTASLDFEHDPSQGLAEALTSPERLDDVLLDRLLQKCTDRLSIFAAPNVLDRDYDLPADSFGAVMDIVLNAAPSVVVDLPHIWSKWTRSVLQTADEIVLTATPDLSSFRNAKNIVETVKGARVNDPAPVLILNQTGVPKRPEVPAEQFEDALGIPVFATLPWDPVAFGTAATNAEPLTTVAPRSKGAAAIEELAARLLGRPVPSAKGRSVDLKSLFALKR